MAKNKENVGILQRIKLYLMMIWREYTFVTSVYMLEPIEGAIFTTVIFLVLFTSCYTAYIFLPPHVYMILVYLGFIDSTETNINNTAGQTAHPTIS